MLRLYKDTVQKIILMLDYMRHSKLEIHTVANHVYGQRDRGIYDDSMIGLSRVILQNGTPEEDYLKNFIKELQSQVHQYEAGTGGDNSLIDNIVQVIQLPYARNGISRNILNRLRQALLIPEEMAKLNATLQRREMECLGCNTPLVPGEMVSFVLDGNDVILYCTSCRKPEFVSCDECEEVVEIDKRLRAALKKPALCAKHGKPAEGEPVAATTGTNEINMEDVERIRERVRVAAGARIANLPVAQNRPNYIEWGDPIPVDPNALRQPAVAGDLGAYDRYVAMTREREAIRQNNALRPPVPPAGVPDEDR